MALTLRANGTGASNLITSDWFNDFYKLFTGTMVDQPITHKPNTTHQAIAGPPAAPTLTVVTGSNLGIGAYSYAATYVTSDGGETLLGTVASTTTTTGNQAVNLSVIPVDSTGAATKRKLYRTKVGGSTYYLLTTINDNTTTTYSDTTADTSLTVTYAVTHPTFGGAIIVKDQTGATNLTIASDGSIVASSAYVSGTSTLNGNVTINGTLTMNNTSFENVMQVFGNLLMQAGTHVSLDNGLAATDGSGNLTVVNLIATLLKVNTASSVINGSTAGTATFWQFAQGTFKILVVNQSGFRNGGASAQNYTLPTAFTTGAWILTTGTNTFSLLSSTVAQTCNVITGLASTGGSTAAVTSVGSQTIGDITHGFDTFSFQSGAGSAHTGWCVIIGV